jgi:hypothetical protein
MATAVYAYNVYQCTRKRKLQFFREQHEELGFMRFLTVASEVILGHKTT